MKRKHIILLTMAVVLVLIGTVAWCKFASRTRIAFLNYQAIELGQIAKANDNAFIKVCELSVEDIDDIDDYDMVFVNGMGMRITAEQRATIQKAANEGTPILTTMATNPENNICSVDSFFVDDLKAYLSGGGRANYRNMLEYVRSYIDGKLLFNNEPADPVEQDSYLLSHPDLKDIEAEELGFNSVREYNEFLSKEGLLKEDAPTVVITGQMGEPAELIVALEKSGCNVYRVWNMREFVEDGHADSINVNAIVNMAHGRMGDYMVDYLTEKNIPMFATVNVNQLHGDWENDQMGINGGFLSQSIVTPEIDGAIRPYALFAQYEDKDGIRQVKCIPGRLECFVQTVNNYIALQTKQNREKRVAIVYFKGPGMSAMTAAGMEVAPSLFNLLKRMEREGYNVNRLPADVSALEKAIQQNRRLQYGNIALVPQPLPNQGDNEFKIIHGTDQDPDADYIAAYRWIGDTLRADALIHFGTHGSLEFTPRKQVALNSNDWPDRLVGAMPHFYVYSIADVGEAMIAKRRSYATIQSHLTPPFMESNLRSEYKQLTEKIQVYNNAPTAEASLAVKRIAVGMGLHRDLELDSLLSKPYSEEDIARIENFAEEISMEKMSGRLYILGEPYETKHINASVFAMSVDPIAYSLLALDRLRNPEIAKKAEKKAWFNLHYLEPAKQLVRRHLTAPTPLENEVAALLAPLGITKEDIAAAHQIEEERTMPQKMMEMMMSGAMSRSGASGSGKSVDRQMTKALAMAKKMGATDEQLKRMKEGMMKKQGKSNAKAGKPKASNASMGGMGAGMKMPQHSAEETARANAILEVERTIKNIAIYRRQLTEAPEAELASMMNALNGGYTAPSPGGDPIANPNALPTGRNLYGINAEATPTEAAWEKGKAMAENTIKLYRQRHNDSIPRKVSYTLWSGEFIESGGATIAQVLYMLGVEPVRDTFGRVTDLRLIPSEELGRPRIDVVVQTSGQLRDIAASRLFLISRAVQMAAAAENDEYTNQVAEGVKESEAHLVNRGVSPKDARKIATHRVFGGLNGGYGTGIQGMVQKGEAVEGDIADTYINNMGAYYGDEKEWEAYSQYAFEAALTGTDAVVQPRQSNTWGALSLDHVYEFMGGMNLAVRNVTGKDPDAYMSDYRNRSHYRMQEVKEAIGVESRSTIFNPNYIREKMKGGAGDAETFAETVQNTYGWNVMKPKAIDAEMWQEIYDTYVADKHNLGLKEFFKDKNPVAMQQMTATMRQAADKGFWKPTAEQRQELEQLNNEMQTTIAANTPADQQDKGMVMKREELNHVETTTIGNVGTIAVVIVLIAVAIALMVVVRRRRNRE